MTRPRHILIVEDDEAIATALALNLKIEGYQSSTVTDGDEALAAIEERRPCLVLLDIGLPGKNGLDVLGELRGRGDTTPVVVLSARQEEFDKVAALKLGADDYVTKPFALAELMARVGAVLRRYPAVEVPAEPREASESGELPRQGVLAFGEVSIDQDTRDVSRNGEPVRLTHLEFELLTFFVRNPSRVFSREALLERVWNIKYGGSRRTVDNFVGQLRGKLEPDPENPCHFVTVRGSGYRFDP